jgi:adenosylcobinamide-phosphate synthase
MKIYRLLEAGDGETAKKELSMLVGRDTRDMTRPEIARACVETVAENSVDGLIAPLFFAAIGGGPLALAYRAVNTCDSMVGYRNARYEQFGKASARLDDAANFIPARIAIPLVALAALFLKLDAKGALHIGLRDRLKHPSPNSAHAEAAFAGALGVQLGGLSHYGGVPKEKPMLGDARMPLEPDHIARSVRLLRGVTLVACVFFAFAARWR